MVALLILAGNSISGTANSYSLLIQVDSVSCLSSLFLLFIDVASTSDAMPPIKPLQFPPQGDYSYSLLLLHCHTKEAAHKKLHALPESLG